MKRFIKKKYIIFPGTAIFLTVLTIALIALQYFFPPSLADKDMEEIEIRPTPEPAKETPVVKKIKKTENEKPPLRKKAEKPTLKAPYAAVVDFLIDPSVKDKSATGSSFAARLEQRLGNKYKLVERTQISKVMEELKLQSSDLAKTPQASEFGKIVGAEFLITGSVLKSGGKYVVAAKIFDLKGQITQKAEITVEKLESISKDDFRRLAKLLTMSPKERTEKAAINAIIDEAESCMKRKDYAKAANNLEKASMADPENQRASTLLREAKEKLKEQVLNSKRNDEFNKIYARGLESLRKKDLKKAAALFRKALKMTGPEHIQEGQR